MAILPCFRWQRPQKLIELTPDERRPLWEYMKRNYFDVVPSRTFEEAVQDMARITGEDPRIFIDAIAGPKQERMKTNEMYRKEDARRQAIKQARQAVQDADKSPIYKALSTALTIPRSLLTFAHGAVFPITHAGGRLMNPSDYGQFFPNWWKAVKMGWSYDTYLKVRRDLVSDPMYSLGRQKGGLKINPDEGPQGILTHWMTSRPGWSQRAWLALQKMRLDIWKADMEPTLKRYQAGEISKAEFDATAKAMGEVANHATGVTNHLLGPLGKVAFAPQLTASKFMRAVVDPLKTLHTFTRMATGDGKNVSFADKQVAYKRLKNATEFLAVSFGGLVVNQLLMKAMGSKEDINFNNPRKPDFWRFKTGDGHVLQTRGPEEFLRFFGDLIATGYVAKSELKGESRRQAAADTVTKFLQYKLDPTIALGLEAGYGRDVFGRPLPDVVQKARGLVGLPYEKATATKPQYGSIEYAAQHGPIFIGGAARDVYNAMREHGMSAPDAVAMARGALVAAGEFFGFSGYEQARNPPAVGMSRATAHRRTLHRMVRGGTPEAE